ncbi:MAG: class A beta-lactamase-related serine hydrolase [Microscillaceae bacterium]|nr:class A beta-lactamase-related serine hydrolase [Microscillaceae bacterium]MDW8460743.1 serine hydrolase [Cytophagales bacterium]
MGKNIDKIMPLASTVKIILAIEYAEQSANGQLNPDKMVSINELDKFYIPIPMAALIQVG